MDQKWYSFSSLNNCDTVPPIHFDVVFVLNIKELYCQ